MLRATGDKVMFSPTNRATRDEYDEARFPQCSTNVVDCLRVARLEPLAAPSAANDEAVAIVPGEGANVARTRLIGSRFRGLHAALLLKWRMTRWEAATIEAQREEVLQAVEKLVSEYCRVEGLTDASARVTFLSALRAIAAPKKRKRGQESMRVEDMATLLWTAADPVTLWHPRKGPIELCCMINQALRADGEEPSSPAARGQPAAGSSSHMLPDAARNSPLLAPAVVLTCIMQLHTNATRRPGYHEVRARASNHRRSFQRVHR